MSATTAEQLTDALLANFTIETIKPWRGADNSAVEGALDDPARQVHGFEVTSPQWAARLDSNVDPQHGPGAQQGAPAAVEAVLADDYAPPPAGSLLVTLRPDADAYAAMLLAAARTAGLDVSGPEVAGNVARIAAADRSAVQPWVPGVERDVDEGAAALASVITSPKVGLAQKVSDIASFLATGTFAGQQAAQDRRRATEERTAADVAARGGVRLVDVPFGQVALVESTEFGALALGYRFAPVVVATNPQFRRPGSGPEEPPVVKHTVCRFNAASAPVDLPAAAEELTAAEVRAGLAGGERWGGQPDIIGSPQGVSSRLSPDEVVRVLAGPGVDRLRGVHIGRRRPGPGGPRPGAPAR